MKRIGLSIAELIFRIAELAVVVCGLVLLIFR